MRRYLENCRSIRLAVFLVISEFLNGHFSFEHDKAVLIGIDARESYEDSSVFTRREMLEMGLENAQKNTFSSIRKHTNAKATKWNLLAESIPANTTKSIPKAYIILASKPAQNNSLSQAVRSFANRFRLTARKDTLKI